MERIDGAEPDFVRGICTLRSGRWKIMDWGIIQWKFQDPKVEVLYHIRPYFEGISPYIGLIYGRYLQSIGSWNGHWIMMVSSDYSWFIVIISIVVGVPHQPDIQMDDDCRLPPWLRTPPFESCGTSFLVFSKTEMVCPCRITTWTVDSVFRVAPRGAEHKQPNNLWKLLVKIWGVSWNEGTPKSSISGGISSYKPTILGYPHFRKPPKYLKLKFAMDLPPDLTDNCTAFYICSWGYQRRVANWNKCEILFICAYLVVHPTNRLGGLVHPRYFCGRLAPTKIPLKSPGLVHPPSHDDRG